MRTLDGYLSRRAQRRLDSTALVYREEDGRYTLEREGQAPLALGAHIGEAQQALQALADAREARDDR